LILAGIEKKLFWNIKKQGRIIGSAVGWISDQIRSNYQWEKEKRSHSFNGGWGV